MFPLFNMLSRFFFAFLPRSKHLFSFHGWSHHPQWFSSPRKWSLSLFPFFPPSICCEVMGPDATILVFWMLSFKPACSLSCFTFIKRLFSSGLRRRQRQKGLVCRTWEKFPPPSWAKPELGQRYSSSPRPMGPASSSSPGKHLPPAQAMGAGGPKADRTQGNERTSLMQRGRPSSRGSLGAAVDGEGAAEG